MISLDDSKEKQQKQEGKKKQHNWLIVLALIFLAPLGIFLMYKYTKWNKYTKGIATIFSLLSFLIIILAFNPTPSININGVDSASKTLHTDESSYLLKGDISSAKNASLKINDKNVRLDSSSKFDYRIKLEEGNNKVVLILKSDKDDVRKVITIHRTTAAELAKRAEEKAKKEKAIQDKKDAKAKEDKESQAKKDAQKEKDNTAKNKGNNDKKNVVKENPQEKAKAQPPAKPENKPEPVTVPISDVTVSQKNAVRQAKSYLDYTGFSHDGLVAQLEYEKFSHADAVYGADNAGANWNEQAAKSAKDYMSYSAFSRGSLIDQLKYDKYTQEQAEYGATAVGL